MRNAGYGDEESRRISPPYQHGNFDGGRWSIIKVARTAFPFYGKFVDEAPAKTTDRVARHDVNDVISLWHLIMPRLWERGHGWNNHSP